jgi:hypothetical protein
MNKPTKAVPRKWLYGALALGTATAAVAVATANLPAYAAPVALTLSSATGPSAGGNALTGVATPTTANPTPFPDGTALSVQFQYYNASNTTCYGSGTFSGTAAPRASATVAASGAVTTGGYLDATGVKRVSTTKLAFTVPIGLTLAGTQTTARWNVCVYGGGALLATSSYTINARPKITGITPVSSPSLGGQSITINGEGFSTTAGATSVTIGGTALTNVKVSSTGTSLTAVTPQHVAASSLGVIVSTAGGTVSSLDPNNDGVPADNDLTTLADNVITFDYSNGITVTPNTAPNTAPVDIDVRGVGFQDFLLPGASADEDSEVARVFLLESAYAVGDTGSATGPECTGVLVIDDTELICTLDLNGDDNTDAVDDVALGTYTVTVVQNASDQAADLPAANPSIISSGSTFTVAPY